MPSFYVPYFHALHPGIAKSCGIPPAILYNYFEYMIKQHSLRDRTPLKETWVEAPLKRLRVEFEYMGHNRLTHSLKILVERGLLKRETRLAFRQGSPYWYALGDENCIAD